MKTIQPGHGSGGKLMNELINSVIRSRFGSENIQLDDSAILDISSDRVAFTTDTYTISPLFFPGGNIGTLAVNGTVNDLAVMGAHPMYLSCGLILEQGFPIPDLEKVLDSMRSEADAAGVRIVTGDTKVVERGKADGIFINTCGIGTLKNPVRSDITPGDRIIISGTIGDHGMAIMAMRNRLTFSGDLRSDCAHLNHLIGHALDRCPEGIKFMRDPTRGGVASVLNEITSGNDFSARLYEEHLPVRDEVRGVCGILGLDPLYSANEGKVVFIVSEGESENLLRALRENEKGKDACIIGEIDTAFPGGAYIETAVGGRRIIPLLAEEQLPRIC